jgi:hypothetical protein
MNQGNFTPFLNAMHSLRVSSGTKVTIGTTVGSGQVKLVHGGSFVAIGNNHIGTDVQFTADAGTIYIDDPANINSGSIGAFAPPLLAPPVPPEEPPPVVEPPRRNLNPTIAAPEERSPNRVATDTVKITQTPPPNPLVCKPTSLDAPDDDNKETDSSGQSWMVAGGSCQPFSFEGDDGSVVVGSGGTTFAPTKTKTILLKEGKMVAVAGKTGTIIETKQGNVHIPADGSTIVEQKQSGVIRVANLSGAKTDVAVTKNGETKIVSAEAGEEVFIADEGLADEELIPVDGVDREPISGAVAIAGTKVKKVKFDRRMMAEREQLLICNTGCFTVAMRKKIENMKQDMGADQPLSISHRSDSGIKTGAAGGTMTRQASAPATGSGSSTGSSSASGSATQLGPVSTNTVESTDLVPIGFLNSGASAAGAGAGVYTLNTNNAVVKHTGRAKLTMDKELINVKNGEMVIDSHKQTIVKAGGYTFTIAPNTIALVSSIGDVVKVTNLYESGTNSIRGLVSGKTVDIAAGQEVLFGPADGSLIRALKGDSIGRRRLRTIDLPNKRAITRCEVSLVSLLTQGDVLSHIRISTKPADRQLTEKLLKMSAVLTTVTASHGAFAPVGGQQ